MKAALTRDPHFGLGERCVHLRICATKIGSITAKTGSPAPADVVARKQRWPCVKSGDVAATDAVAARVAAIVAAGRVSPTCVRVTVAIVVIVVPRRGGGSDCGREHFVSVYRSPVLPTRNPSGADWGRRSSTPRLCDLDPQRDAVPFRTAERQQRHTCNGRGRDCSFFQSHLHEFSPSPTPTLQRYARDQPNGRHVRKSIVDRTSTVLVPRLTATTILSGSAVHVKGFGRCWFGRRGCENGCRRRHEYFHAMPRQLRRNC